MFYFGETFSLVKVASCEKPCDKCNNKQMHDQCHFFACLRQITNVYSSPLLDLLSYNWEPFVLLRARGLPPSMLKTDWHLASSSICSGHQSNVSLLLLFALSLHPHPLLSPPLSCAVLLLSLYGRHMQANPEPPKKNNDKSKKISRKPLAAKNKWTQDGRWRWTLAQPARLTACAFFFSLFVEKKCITLKCIDYISRNVVLNTVRTELHWTWIHSDFF